MSVENWKLEKDLCRCCLSEGTFQNLAEPCMNQGAEEIYSDMLIEGLDVNLTPVSGPLCTSTYTICEECILRLRDACSFKRQVLLSEKRFRELYSKDIIKCHSSVKKEAPDSDNEGGPVKQEMMEDDDDYRHYDDDDDGELKSEIEVNIQEVKKAKTRKPKAKEKPKPKKRAGRPRKPQTDVDAEADVDEELGEGTNDNKDPTCTNYKDFYTTISNGANQKYKCNKCDKVYHAVNTIKNHIFIVHIQQLSKCLYCGKEFLSENMKNKHSLYCIKDIKEQIKDKSDPTKPHICDHCDKNIKGRNTFLKHLKTHKLAICSVCSAHCKDQRGLVFHKHEVHGAAIPTCGVCGFKSWPPNKITRHQRKVHMKEKNVSCTECSLKFFDNTALHRHMVRHAPVKKHECPLCLKKFPRRSAMQMHLKIHTGDKKKVCPLCDAKFVQRASLTYHMTKHHPESVSLLD